MATTFTGVFLGVGPELLLAHAGDSRAYLLRDSVFARQTRDDSYVQALVDHGIISAEAAAAHPRRNIITASLGGSEGDVVSVAAHP
ncbi:serine/threonine-protein phosphatase, partial [Klebsiella pneumoniae]